MFKKLHTRIWVFDAEWVPDPNAGRALYRLPNTLSDKEVIERMWKEAGATEDDPNLI